MTPLLRELAPIPIFGSASRTKTSPQRAERARAIAQPTTPPPMITMLACSTVYSLAGHLRIRSWSILNFTSNEENDSRKNTGPHLRVGSGGHFGGWACAVRASPEHGDMARKPEWRSVWAAGNHLECRRICGGRCAG